MSSCWARAGSLGVLLIGLAAYALPWRIACTVDRHQIARAAVATAPEATKKEAAKQTASRPALDGDDLEPGVDGGSSDTGLPYYLRRQAVYYRTVYSAGMLVVDRSQRFLYLVQPQARALRYGIGVGGECAIGAGLYRIQSKSHWPEWSPSPALLKRTQLSGPHRRRPRKSAGRLCPVFRRPQSRHPRNQRAEIDRPGADARLLPAGER